MDEVRWPFGDPWVLLAALAIDLVFGEPPNRFHPVAWMGGLIDRLRTAFAAGGRWKPLLGGAAIVALGSGLAVALGSLVLVLRPRMPALSYVTEAIALKAMFSVRGLASAALQVRDALAAKDLPEARRLLSWHLVSRDTAALDEAGVAAAVIESVAENASDSVVAPWLFYLAGGLPAALAYRFVNTADAMLGYRDAEREWLGKVPARLDDFFNLAPARLTAAFALLAGPVVGGSWRRGLRVWWADARKTASPNAGHPMAAAAGALGVELDKVGCYRLGAGMRPPEPADIGRAVRLLGAVVGLSVGAAFAATYSSRLLGW
jgi:adenosylcobinamide-phosphate synthase